MLDARLVHVVAVARAGSFTAAAQAVGVTQSAVTKSVADLERRLGFLLFHRTARGAMLTEDGRDFVLRAERVLEDARALMEGPSRDDPYATALNVAVCPASVEWCLVDPVSALLRRHPAVRVDVMGATFERVVQLVRSGAIDVAVGYDAAFAEWPDIAREALDVLPAQLFVRQGHPILDCAQVTERELSNYDFVSSSESRPYGARIRSFYENHGVDWQRRIHVVDYFPLVRRIVAQSDAVGVVARGYAARPWFRSRFATLDGFHPFDPAPLCCATRARWEPKPAARAFIELMRASLVLG